MLCSCLLEGNRSCSPLTGFCRTYEQTTDKKQIIAVKQICHSLTNVTFVQTITVRHEPASSRAFNHTIWFSSGDGLLSCHGDCWLLTSAVFLEDLQHFKDSAVCWYKSEAWKFHLPFAIIVWPIKLLPLLIWNRWFHKHCIQHAACSFVGISVAYWSGTSVTEQRRL